MECQLATIKEIADKVGVSQAAVSRVLSNDTTLSLSLSKRRAILETAAALNYVSPSARRGSTQKNSKRPRIGLIEGRGPEEELADPFFLMLRLGAERRLREFGFEPVGILHDSSQHHPSLFARLSGLITLAIYAPNQIEALHAYSDNIVVTDFSVRTADRVDRVGNDLAQAITDLMNALYGFGYRRMGFIGWPARVDEAMDDIGDERSRSYMAWMREAGLFDPGLYAVSDFAVGTGYELAQSLLKRSRPDVLIAGNDSIALSAYRAIADAGLSIPGDIAVVSFNDTQAAQFLAPALSTVRLSPENIGSAAADLVRERVEGRNYVKRVSIPTQMIWRESCPASPVGGGV